MELAEGRPLVIGRDPSAEIRIDDPSMSRRHASVLLRGATVELRDLGSRNGVHVNGTRIGEGGVAIHPDDQVTVGPASLMLLDADEEPAR